MGTTDVALERVFRRLIWGNVGLCIAEMETYLAAWPHAQTKEKLETLKREYNLMAGYWQQGVSDPHLKEQYQSLLQRLYVVCANVSIYRHMTGSSFLNTLYTSVRTPGTSWSIEDLRSEMEGFVSDVAMLELEADGQRKEKSLAVYRQHQQQMNRLFNYVLTSHIWTKGIADQMEELLLTPTVDTVDQQLLVSAIMLSLMNRFDMSKFRLLVHVYQHTADKYIRQRALIGWVMSIDDDYLSVYPEQYDLISDLLRDPQVCNELTELQIQMVYTLNAEKDTTTLRDEILPELMKNNQFKMTERGIEEVEEDPLEEVLHPEASEQRMEQLEQTVRRMQNMHQQGADVFFWEFSQMKRFPFFYDISNWFVPFFRQHPDIAQFVTRLEDQQMLWNMLKKTPLCNSDKYSLVIAFQQVISQLPENVRQLMKNGDAALMFEADEELTQSPAYIRRNCLMDMYRFFRLFPNRSALCNPFDTTVRREMGQCLFFGSKLFSGTPLEERKREVVAMLLKHKLKRSADALLETFPEAMHDVQYYLWKEDYIKVLELEPDNERALVEFARIAFRNAHYEFAQKQYERLLLLHPHKTSYMLNRAVCLTRMEEYEEALHLLYELNYKQPENVSVNRVLAWTQVCTDKLEQAVSLYRQLTAMEQATAEDYLNQGYCLWFQGRRAEAVVSFRKSMELSNTNSDDFWLAERQLLQQKGISDTDIKLMTDWIISG